MLPVNLESERTSPSVLDDAHARLARIAGVWSGTAKTWLEPGAAPMEAGWEGRAASILGGRFLRFEYRSSIGQEPLAGELMIAFESGEKLWRISWVDSFHTGTAILVSVGESTRAAEIDVRGDYFAAEGHPRWGWRTRIDDSRADSLSIRMFNITPEGEEMPGVEVTLERA